MGSYNRDDRSGGQRSFGRGNFGRPSFRGNEGPREMFKAVCGKCGKDCEVPFRPSGDRPVFCSECFQNSRGEGDSRNYSNRGTVRPSYQPRPVESRPQNNDQLGEISRKLDRIIDMLTVKPTADVQPEVIETVKEVVVPVVEEKVAPKKKAKASKKVTPEVKE
jgi:CxxC-x17-CxxC domain-containing protein